MSRSLKTGNLTGSVLVVMDPNDGERLPADMAARKACVDCEGTKKRADGSFVVDL